MKATFSASDDVNFGRCIVHSSSISCSNTAQEQIFISTKLNATFNYESDFTELSAQEDFQNCITVYSIYDHLVMYKMNSYFAKVYFYLNLFDLIKLFMLLTVSNYFNYFRSN